jgi:hypothetical protein
MPWARIRRPLIAVAALTVCLWLARLAATVTVGTRVPSLNATIVVAALAFLVVELALLRLDACPVFLRIIRSIAVAGLGLSTVIFGLFAISLCTCIKEIGAVSAGTGRLVAYRVSVPLVDDFVVVESERRLIPGLYYYRRLADIDPAWDPKIQTGANGRMLVSYGDEENLRRLSIVSVAGITARWSGP